MTRLIHLLVDMPPLTGGLMKVTFILGLGWVLHLALWRANPRWRVLLWRAVSVGVLLIPCIAWMMPTFEVSMPVDTRQVVSGAAAANVEAETVAAIPRQPFPASIGPSDAYREPLLTRVKMQPWLVATTIYFCICAAMAGRLALNLRSLNRMLACSKPIDSTAADILRQVQAALGINRAVDLRVSDGLSSPFLYGLRRPAIMLPERMAQADYASELPGIFLHELAHVQGRDLIWMNLIHVVSIALWFHPLAWRMRAVHAASCEAVCDAVAAEHVGSAVNYSRTLARIALELVALPPTAGGIAMARIPEVRRRLEMLKLRTNANPLARRRVIFLLILGCVVLSVIGGIQIVSAQNEPVYSMQEIKLPADVATACKLINNSFETQRSKVKNLWFKATYIQPKIAIKKPKDAPNDWLPRENDILFSAEESTVIEQEYQVTLKGEFIFHTYQYDIKKGGKAKSAERKQHMSCDGKIYRYLEPGINSTEGTIFTEKQNLDWSRPMVKPTSFLPHLFDAEIINMLKDDKNLSVSLSQDGLWLAEYSRPGADYSYKMYLNPKQGFMIKKFIVVWKSGRQTGLTMEYNRTKDGFYYPIKGASINPDSEPGFVLEVKDFKINISDGNYSIDFPIGTLVSDYSKDTPERYFMRANNQKEKR